MLSPRAIATCILALGPALATAADPPTDNGVYNYIQKIAPSNPTGGPPDIFVYSNLLGTWKIAKGNGAGSATYTWNGQMNKDNLEYLGFGEVTDTTGVGIPKGQKESVWMFKATDAANPNPTNVIFFAFGVAPLNGVQGTKYAFYYSWKDPTVAGNDMKRILLKNGTSRQ